MSTEDYNYMNTFQNIDNFESRRDTLKTSGSQCYFVDIIRKNEKYLRY